MISAPLMMLGLLLAASRSQGDELKDMYFSEALFYAHLGLYFEALERHDTEVKLHGRVDEPELDTF